MRACEPCKADPAVSSAATFDAIEDTESFVAANDDMIMVVFRGTQEATDWVTNLDIVERPVPESWGLNDDSDDMHKVGNINWNAFIFALLGSSDVARYCRGS